MMSIAPVRRVTCQSDVNVACTSTRYDVLIDISLNSEHRYPVDDNSVCQLGN